MTIENVFIVGAGLMGSGIAQVCAQAGIHVFLNDVSREVLDKGLKTIDWSVGKFVEKGKLSEDKDTILERIRPVTDFADAAEADLAIEVVFEKKDLKQEIFKKLDRACNPDAMIASMSLTARSNPTRTALDTMLCPMLRSSIPGIAATSAVF